MSSCAALKSALYEYDAIGRVEAVGARNAAAIRGVDPKNVEEPAVGDFVGQRLWWPWFMSTKLSRGVDVQQVRQKRGGFAQGATEHF